MSDDPQASGGVGTLRCVSPLHIGEDSHGTQGPNRLANGKVPTITYRFPVAYMVIGSIFLALGLIIGPIFKSAEIMLAGLTVFLAMGFVTILKANEEPYSDDVSGVGESQ